jgi:hypothetical protein
MTTKRKPPEYGKPRVSVKPQPPKPFGKSHMPKPFGEAFTAKPYGQPKRK